MSFVRDRKLAAVAAATLAFRLLFIVWGWTGWHTATSDPSYMMLQWIYAAEGYGLCAGYGYAVPPKTVPSLATLAASQRITPSAAPRIDPSTLVPEMWHPPGMAILNAAVHILTGMRVGLPIQLVGAFFDTIAACLVYWIAATFLQPKVGLPPGFCMRFILHRPPRDDSPKPRGLPVVVRCRLPCVRIADVPLRRKGQACLMRRSWRFAGSRLLPSAGLPPCAGRNGAGIVDIYAPILAIALWHPCRAACGVVDIAALGLSKPWPVRSMDIFVDGCWRHAGHGIGGISQPLGPWGNRWGSLGGEQSTWFFIAMESGSRSILSRGILEVNNEKSVWLSCQRRQTPAYDADLAADVWIRQSEQDATHGRSQKAWERLV